MPWCQGCQRYLAAPTVTVDGACPQCGRPVQSRDTADAPRAPWHFKVLVAAAGGYLLMRAVQGVGWVLQNLP